MDFTFAPAAEADFERLLAIRHAAMRPSLERVGRWHPVRARNRFRAAFAPGSTAAGWAPPCSAACWPRPTRPACRWC